MCSVSARAGAYTYASTGRRIVKGLTLCADCTAVSVEYYSSKLGLALIYLQDLFQSLVGY